MQGSHCSKNGTFLVIVSMVEIFHTPAFDPILSTPYLCIFVVMIYIRLHYPLVVGEHITPDA